MLEYPSMQNSSKAPRQSMVAFDKLDGSNFRAKWTRKRGFDVFGTRTQLIDETSEFWGQAVTLFKQTCAEPLNEKFTRDKDYRDEREYIVYGEFVGPQSFAGRHIEGDKMEVVVFDVLCGHKNRKFVGPMDFIKDFQEVVKIPDVIHVGKLNEEFIAAVRRGDYNVNEGVICKGTIPTGAAFGGIWSCKIKTQAYLDKLKLRYGNEWMKYGE